MGAGLAAPLPCECSHWDLVFYAALQMDHSYAEKLALGQDCILYRWVGRPNIDSARHQEVDVHFHNPAWMGSPTVWESYALPKDADTNVNLY